MVNWLSCVAGYWRNDISLKPIDSFDTGVSLYTLVLQLLTEGYLDEQHVQL